MTKFNRLLFPLLLLWAGFFLSSPSAMAQKREVLGEATKGSDPSLPDYHWDPGFKPPGPSADVLASVVHDDGFGSALYIAGEFLTVGGIEASRIAKWDGTSWSALGSGLEGGTVYDLAVFDDGSGPVLYAAGSFTSAGGTPVDYIARWNGHSWLPVGLGLDNFVFALAVYDDGDGPRLFAGGRFNVAGGLSSKKVAAWDGQRWHVFGSALYGSDVQELIVYDLGAGPTLYAAGGIEMINGTGFNVDGLAKWNGEVWSSVGDGCRGIVDTIAGYDDGSGPALYVGGLVNEVGGQHPAQNLAKWTGSEWVTTEIVTNGRVSSLNVHDDGTGDALFVGGSFTLVGDGALVGGDGARVGGDGPLVVSNLARWDGAWSDLAGGVDSWPETSVTFDAGDGPKVIVGGRFSTAGGQNTRRLANWDGASWTPVGVSEPAHGAFARVEVVAALDAGDGMAVYAGGDFTTMGDQQANRIAKWDGTGWTALGSGFDDDVRAIAVFDDGGGPDIYAGGEFSMSGGSNIFGVARWDGASWSPLGIGISPYIGALASFDGGGAALYVGGLFSAAGGVPAKNVAKWDGSTWSPLAGGVDRVARAFQVFDDGSGPALYVGGSFDTADGQASPGIARWDGVSWSPLGTGTDDTVWGLTVFDDGTGPALYAGGEFSMAGGLPARGIAKWDGTTWSALGAGVNGRVRSLAVLDKGAGPALYVAGYLSEAGGVEAGYIEKWDGTAWSAVDEGGLSFTGSSLTTIDGPEGQELFVGGLFTSAGGIAAGRIARYTAKSIDVFADGFETGDLSLWSSNTP